MAEFFYPSIVEKGAEGVLPYIHIGSVTISCYYLAMVLGYVFMVVLMLLKYRRRMYGLSPIKAFLFATLVLILGVTGCKILFVLENIKLVAKNGFTFGGFSFYGAVLFIPLVMPLCRKPFRLDTRSVLDSSAICIVAMLGTIRIGCYCNGCCGGRVFGSGQDLFTLPTQLIECALDFLILFLLLRYEKKGRFQGRLYPKFLLLYGAGRFFIEFLRATSKDWLSLSHAQWFSMAAMIIGIAFELRSVRRGKEQPEQTGQ